MNRQETKERTKGNFIPSLLSKGGYILVVARRALRSMERGDGKEDGRFRGYSTDPFSNFEFATTLHVKTVKTDETY